MVNHRHGDWCALFETIDACASFDQFAALAVTKVCAALECSGGSVQEVVYTGSSSSLRRHFVTAALEKNVRRYISNFDKISASLLGGAERKDLAIYLMGSRLDHALDLNFDPRPVWRGSGIRSVLAMRVPLAEATDVYFTFNRSLDASDFEGRDMRNARQVFSMLSATSRRLYAEERLHFATPAAEEMTGQTILGTVGLGETRYLLSRVACMKKESREADEVVVYARPSDSGDGRQRLTPAELTIALLAARGHSNKAIARLRSLSVYTVENHLKSVYRKLGVSGRCQLAPTFLVAH